MDPAPLGERVLAARDRYLRANGLTLAEYDATHFGVRLGPWTVRLPNPPQRRANVARHDLHHVATGFATDWRGEIEISAWEVGAGLGGLWVAWVVCVPLFAAGVVVAPRRTIRAFRAGRGGRSLFVDEAPYEELVAMTVAELRQRLGVPAAGLAARASS